MVINTPLSSGVTIVFQPPELGVDGVCIGESEDECEPWRVEVRELEPLPHVKGRLKSHLAFWESELQAPQAVLSIIESGYVQGRN